MKVATFAHARDPLPHVHDLSWDDFVHQLGPHDFTRTDKLSLPGFSPAEFAPGTTRKNRNVVRVHAAVLDLDKLTETAVQATLDVLQGTASVLYTTWSHPREQASTGLWRLRAVVSLSRPVEASEWSAFWPRLFAHFKGHPDQQCSDPARFYFGAFQPPGTESTAEFLSLPGDPLDVSALFSSSVPPPIEATPARSVSLPEFLDFGRTLRTRSASLATAIKLIGKGEPFAEPGTRDDTIFRLAAEIARQWPEGDAAQIAQHFAPSLAVMHAASPHDAFTPTDVAAKIHRQQEQRQIDAFTQEQAQIDARKLRLQQAFGKPRDYPYTPEELDTLAKAAGTTRPELVQRWIIQRGSSFYTLRPNGSYNSPPWTDADITAAVLTDLAPAISAGVDLFKFTRQGELVQKSARELVHSYGQTADNVSSDLRAQRTTFNETTRTIIEAPCPLRDLPTANVPDVAKWLALLAPPDKLDHLLDWIATVTNLEQPSAALYLEGPPHTGKSLLAYGLARLWRDSGPTSIVAAMDTFNDALARNPLVLADETLPTDWTGNGRTAELREFIQASERPLNRKYLPRATLYGAIRLIIAANNRDLLFSKDHLTSADIDAISERFLHINAQEDAANFLRSRGGASDFVRNDLIAIHARHLAATRKVHPGPRFLVEGDCAELHRSLTTGSGLRSALCHWLVSYLLRPQPLDSRGEFFVRVHRERLLVNAQGLAGANWDLYPTSVKIPSLNSISKALVGLSEGERPYAQHPQSKARIRYRNIRTENLIAWADETEFSSADAITEALRRETPEPARIGENVSRIR